MGWTVVLKFLTSKTGKVAIVVLIILAMIAGYKWKIASLERQLDRANAKNATMQIRNTICESDLGVLKTSVDRQNQMVMDLQRDNDTLEEDARQRAEDSFRSPEDIELIVHEGSGPDQMNVFVEELFQGVSR